MISREVPRWQDGNIKLRSDRNDLSRGVWTDLYATAFWTKYNNVGFTNNIFDPNTSLPPAPQQLYADTKTYGLELDGEIYPVDSCPESEPARGSRV